MRESVGPSLPGSHGSWRHSYSVSRAASTPFGLLMYRSVWTPPFLINDHLPIDLLLEANCEGGFAGDIPQLFLSLSAGASLERGGEGEREERRYCWQSIIFGFSCRQSCSGKETL